MGKDMYTYLAFSLMLILAHYIVPYTILRNSKGFTLFLFWSLLVALWVIVTIIFIERRWFK